MAEYAGGRLGAGLVCGCSGGLLPDTGDMSESAYLISIPETEPG